MQTYPLMQINLSKIEHNAALIVKKCKEQNINPYLVTKGISADLHIFKTFIAAGYRQFADSRLHNIQKMKKAYPNGEYMMLRIPGKSEVELIVEVCDISLNSEWETIYLLDKAANKMRRKHRIILMVELGDLREGIYPNAVLEMIEKIDCLEAVELEGIGTNFGCFGGVFPSEESIHILTELVRKIERRRGKRIRIVSGGNSSTLPFIYAKKSLGRINQLRIGESIYLGVSTIDGSPIKGLYQDAFQLQAEIVEIHVKPMVSKRLQTISKIWKRNVDVEDMRLKAIVSLGTQDVEFRDIKPVNPLIKIIGGSSDHLILDISKAKPMQIGEKIVFTLSYKGMMRCMTSPYVGKRYWYDRILDRRLGETRKNSYKG
ncbi:alanine racemase [Bacillus spongiae]|uniref:Alanine racemase n=1 Tax=Bacillus spongiae TaxID=2683610 RepID=A0ABU8H9P0_9BACI